MRIMIKTPKKKEVKNKQNPKHKHNPTYPLPREGHFPHISVATITMFPGSSLISSN